VQFKLLNALEGGSSPVLTNAGVRIEGVAELAARLRLDDSQSRTRLMEAEASIPTFAWSHEQGSEVTGALMQNEDLFACKRLLSCLR